MKRILFLFAIMATLLSLGSCGKLNQPDQIIDEGATYTKIASVNLDIPETKANEDLDIYIEVYCNDRLWDEIRPTSSNFDIPLVFSTSFDYKYRFDAYVNYGLYANKSNELSFTQESRNRFTSFGSVGNIGENDVNSIVIDLVKNVNHIKVQSLKFEGFDPAVLYGFHGYTVTYYIANAPELIGNGSSVYNKYGYLTSESGKDLLFSKHPIVDAELDNNIASNDMYYYPRYHSDDEDCEREALMIRLSDSHNNNKPDMYYHVILDNTELKANQSKVLDITIYQEGANAPFGELPEQSIKVSSLKLVNSGFETSVEEVTIGSNNGIFTGAAIVDCYDTYYEPEEWIESGKSIDEALGVLVSDGEHRFIIHPTAEILSSTEEYDLSEIYYNNQSYRSLTLTDWRNGYDEDEIFNAFIERIREYYPSVSSENYGVAQLDFNGYEHSLNTCAVYNGHAIEFGYMSYCKEAFDYSKFHDAYGHLMSAGEATMIYKCIDQVNACLNALGGVPMDMSEKMYMTSSILYMGELELPYSYVWVGGFSNHVTITSFCDTNNIYVRPIIKY